MKIDPIKTRKSHIQNDATGSVWPLEIQKLFGRAKCLHIEFNGADEAFQRFPDGSVIIDDEHHGLTHHAPLYDLAETRRRSLDCSPSAATHRFKPFPLLSVR